MFSRPEIFGQDFEFFVRGRRRVFTSAHFRNHRIRHVRREILGDHFPPPLRRRKPPPNVLLNVLFHSFRSKFYTSYMQSITFVKR